MIRHDAEKLAWRRNEKLASRELGYEKLALTIETEKLATTRNRQTEVVPVNKRKMNTQEFLEEEKFDSNPKNTKLSIEEGK
ncbi:hypothetical protein IEQ34_008216 [Dendrobium chrysotoxum]|uniref:Uncharacterized protein n=1 Tax=Dendrobium chrysotoxum TaxID=161865 RepID=A0AAV7GPT4_DENCH|nr:hypothetical protein IEQ34_008216 [Dendrobium chrysotoxum]